MFSTFDTSQFEMSLLNEVCANIEFIFSTFDTSHLLISPLNLDPMNIEFIFFTFDTSHSLISPSNLLHVNRLLISSTLLTSMSLRLQLRPCSSIHCLITFLSSPILLTTTISLYVLGYTNPVFYYLVES